jgi:nicotinate-nucleotide adenylyltransferase
MEFALLNNEMIGLLGGTFNPIHFGHLRPTLDIAEQLNLDTVRIIPAKLPPLREKPTIKAEHRLEMVKLAIATEPRFVLDTREFQRNEVSYSVDTLRSLRQELGYDVSLCWIMGMDAYHHFTQWYQWQEILQLCHLVIAHRPNYSPNENKQLNRYHTSQLCDLSHHSAGKIHFIAVTQLDISATMLRQHRKGNRSLRYLLPDAVYNYINENKLYL